MFDPPKDGIVTCVKTNNGKVCALACKEGFDFSETPALFYVCRNSVWSYVSLAPGDLSAPWPQKCEGRLLICTCLFSKLNSVAFLDGLNSGPDLLLTLFLIDFLFETRF